jgi:hypothetical protein
VKLRERISDFESASGHPGECVPVETVQQTSQVPEYPDFLDSLERYVFLAAFRVCALDLILIILPEKAGRRQYCPRKFQNELAGDR